MSTCFSFFVSLLNLTPFISLKYWNYSVALGGAHGSAHLHNLFLPVFSHHHAHCWCLPPPAHSISAALRNMTHKAHLTFSQLDANQRSLSAHWLQTVSVFFTSQKYLKNLLMIRLCLSIDDFKISK